jgi:hypothetical protein
MFLALLTETDFKIHFEAAVYYGRYGTTNAAITVANSAVAVVVVAVAVAVAVAVVVNLFNMTIFFYTR